MNNSPDGKSRIVARHAYAAALVAVALVRGGLLAPSAWGQNVTITTQPQNLTAAAGYNAAFSVRASGLTPLYYQWKKDDVPLAGATASTLNITNVQTTNIGNYTVVVSNSVSSLTSSNALLSVITPYTFVTFAGLAKTRGTNYGMGSAARFGVPHGIAVDGAGNVYVTDLVNNTIRKITPEGAVTTLAGLSGVAGTNDGLGSAARFNQAWGLAVDQQTNIYVADTGNNSIRLVTPAGMVSTLAGSAGVTGYSDGTNTTALFNEPAGLAMDPAGNLYVSDYLNQTIRKITPNGSNWEVTTVAGTAGQAGYRDLQGTSARFHWPVGLGLDTNGNVYISDEYNNCIRKMKPDATVSTLAGYPQSGSSVDGIGSVARFNGPHGPAVDSAGNLFVADMSNGTVRRVTQDGMVTTLAGTVGSGGSADGTGIAARFSGVRGAAVDSLGNVYVTDFDNNTIRKGVPFAITTWPQSQAVLAGQPVTLSVAAAGDNGPFSYQWLSNSVPLAGQTNTTLVIGPVVRTNSGIYSAVVSNAVGNWITIDASVRALVAPIVQAPQTLTNGTLRLLLQDADGGVPYDLTKVALQWRTNLPSGNDTNWMSLASSCYLTNGFVGIDDTNVTSQIRRFYRVLEW